MTPAQRLARLPGCWRPGMLGVFAPGVAQVGWIRILRVGPDGAVYSWVDDGGWVSTADDGGADLSEYVPDLTDPATIGCLAAWCREVYGRPMVAHCEPRGGVMMWHILTLRAGDINVYPPAVWTTGWNEHYPAEGDAWAAAILAKLEPK